MSQPYYGTVDTLATDLVSYTNPLEKNSKYDTDKNNVNRPTILEKKSIDSLKLEEYPVIEENNKKKKIESIIGDIQLRTLASLQSKSDTDIEEAIKKCIVKETLVSTIAALFYSTQQTEVIKESFGIPSLTDIDDGSYQENWDSFVTLDVKSRLTKLTEKALKQIFSNEKCQSKVQEKRKGEEVHESRKRRKNVF